MERARGMQASRGLYDSVVHIAEQINSVEVEVVNKLQSKRLGFLHK